MTEHFSEFAALFETYLTVAWWVPLSALSLVGIAYRLYRALTGEQREVARRHRILKDLEEFIGGATRANRNKATTLHSDMMHKHAMAYVGSLSIRELGEVSGIGEATLRTLEQQGFTTLSSAVQRDIQDAFGLGPVKGQAANAYIRRRIESTHSQLMEDPNSFPHDPGVERIYTSAIEKLKVRIDTLQGDRDGLQPAADEIEIYAAAANARTARVRLREWLLSPIRTARAEPGRPVRFLLVSVLYIVISVAVPLLVLGSTGSDPTASLAAIASGYVALLVLFVVYVFVSDRGLKLGTRALDPTNFQEQRLQFLGLTMALAQGVAPPEVRMGSGVAAETTGHRAGPSLIRLGEDEVGALALQANQEAVEFLLAHEVGKLSGDHQRLATTVAGLAAPFSWLAHQARTLSGWILANLQAKVSCLAVFALAFGLALAAVAVPAAVLLTLLHWSIGTISVVLSTAAVYASDRVARSLTSQEAMLAALEAADHRNRIAHAKEGMAAESALGMDLLVPPPPNDPSSRWNRFFDGIRERFAVVTPNRGRRLRASERGSASVIDVGLGVGQSLLILSLAFMSFWFAGRQGRALAAWWDRPPVAEAARASSRGLLPSPAVGPQREPVVVRVRGNADSCAIRVRPEQTARVVARARNEDVCAVLPSDTEGWYDVVCGDDQGFMGSGCLGR